MQFLFQEEDKIILRKILFVLCKDTENKKGRRSAFDDDWKCRLCRSIISNQACQEEDIDFMLEELDRLGVDLWVCREK